MIADSKFLPLNPWTLIFPGDPGAYIPSLPSTQTRAGQMVRLYDINQLAASWPIDAVNYPGNNYTGGPGSDMLTGIQLEWLQKLYPSGPTPASDTAPTGWTGKRHPARSLERGGPAGVRELSHDDRGATGRHLRYELWREQRRAVHGPIL